MKERNLFIARTPLQLFNCIEAKNRFHDKEENTLFYQYQRQVDKIQMENLIDSSQWSRVVPYPLTLYSKFFFPLYLRGLKEEYLFKISYCYYGVYNSIVSYLINSIQPQKLIIVDDGVKTLGIARNLEAKRIQKQNLFKTIRDKFLNSNRDFLYDSTFFSIYSLEEYQIENGVILNDYRMFKKGLLALPLQDVLYFIGTNLNEKILKNGESFERYLQKVLSYYRDKKIIYILHRYEDIDFIENLAKKYGFDYVKFSNILEVEIAKAGFLPKEFATFGSSAIETLALLYTDCDYKVFSIDSKDIKENKVEAMEKLYQSFREKGYEVIG
jgi:hypothetical protein